MQNIITSGDNKLIKHVKSLQDKKYRNQYNEYIIEGMKIVEEAIENNEAIESIIVCEELLDTENLDNIKAHNPVFVPKNIFMQISDTVTPQGVLAVIKRLMTNIQELNKSCYLVLDNIQDPGNMGTMIRTSEACGVDEIFLSKGCADPYSPKVVRSTMGSIFRSTIHDNIDLKQLYNDFKQNNIKIIVTSLEESYEYYKVDYTQKVAIVIGNESNGISEISKEMSDIRIKIPMMGKIESLNASVAASVVMYEVLKQKNG